MSSTESLTPSILAALSVMTAMKPSEASSRSSDPQYPARAGSNIAPSQCTIAFPETFAKDRCIGLPIGVRADGFGGEVAAGHHDGLATQSLDQRDLLAVRVDDPSPLDGVLVAADRCWRHTRSRRRRPWPRRSSGRSTPSWRPSRDPSRAGRCPSLRRRADPTTTDGDGTPGSSPSRSSRRCPACCRPARRRPRAPRRTDAGSARGRRVARTGSALRACGGGASRPSRGSSPNVACGLLFQRQSGESFRAVVAPSAPSRTESRSTISPVRTTSDGR